MDSHYDIEIEHAISNSKTIEKLITKVYELEMQFTKWLQRFIGASSLIFTCCCILSWTTHLIMDGNNDTNKEQSAKITELQKEDSRLREDVVILQERVNSKYFAQSIRSSN